MDINFQDRIDEYLLHRDSMTVEEQTNFLKEIESNEEKKRQFVLSKDIKDAFVSRGKKLKAIAEFENKIQCNTPIKTTGSDNAMPLNNESFKKTKTNIKEKKTIWLWISGIAAVVIIGVFFIRPTLINNSNNNFMPFFENQYQKKNKNHDFERFKSRKDSIKKDSVIIRKNKKPN